ncbi:MAG TPA: GFA family protein [Rhodocyclaceae bacterium]|nr:GFA family protein [Rhodocyclaceae bacterium]
MILMRGSCLCGGVKFEITGSLSGARNCHCSMCRKAHAAAFRSRAAVNVSDFRWVHGEGLVTYYESSPGTHRGFCRVCGTRLISRFDFDASTYGVPLGVLDDDPQIKPGMHIFVGSKAPWYDITDGLPQHHAFPEP